MLPDPLERLTLNIVGQLISVNAALVIFGRLRDLGSWSAQMFLLRGMARADVFPAGDLGLRRGIESLYALRELPSIPAAAERALAWRPYRSYAAKYLWLHYTAAADT